MGLYYHYARVHGIFNTSKNTAVVFLAIWFYNCEFDKIMTTYCHIHSIMPNLHLTFKASDKNTAIVLSYSQFHAKNTLILAVFPHSTSGA